MTSSKKPDPPRGSSGAMTLQRRAGIAELVRQQGAVRVTDLAERFHTSEVTIRSDLAQLEKEGQLVRDRGGAFTPSDSRHLTRLLEVDQRAGLNIEAKRRIARAAAELVAPGDTIILDAGTTAVEMARYLKEIPGLTILTNGINVALEIAATTDANIILLGGTVNRQASCTLGPLAEGSLGEFIVQKVFLGTQAITLADGLTDTTVEIAQIKRAMIRAGRQVILLADSTKWDKSGFIKVAPLTVLQSIITDEGLPAEIRSEIQQQGVQLRVV